jgi:hypothetical protein
MKKLKKRIGLSGSSKYTQVPRAARLINTVIAIILLGISIYHFTQPNKAWRSGITELIAVILLLTAAYFVSHVKAIMTNLFVAIVILGLGVRHLIYGGGWGSGTTELIFTVLLVAAASMIYRDRRK